MTWVAIGVTVGSAVVGGVMNSSAKNKQAALGYESASQQEQASWTRNISDNKAIAESNLMNTIRTGYKVGLMNVQRAQAKMQAAQAGVNISGGVAQLTGAATANAAAAGQVGSSVDAVLNDLRMKASDAQAQVDENYVQQESNFDTQLHDILTQGTDAIRSAAKSTVQQATAPSYVGAGESIAGSLISAAGQYASSSMGLGLGTKTKTSTPSTGPSIGGIPDFNPITTGVA